MGAVPRLATMEGRFAGVAQGMLAGVDIFLVEFANLQQGCKMTRTMTILGLLGGVVAVSACDQDVNLTQTESELEVSPHLTDLGTVPVGSIETFEIQIDHIKGGDIGIKNIVVQNVEGDYFTFEGETSQTLEKDGVVVVVMTYAPSDEGYHRGTVTITHQGEGKNVTVDVRARAILPEATLWPLGLDFGPVDVGDFNTKDLTLRNQSDLELVIDDAAFSNSVFNLGTDLPIIVTGGNELVIPVEFHPENDNPAQGSLTLRAGEVPLPQVALRGNDCENGSPAAYDQDGDGYTTCGGDCDDDDVDIRPGGTETANGADDDCDGTIDEGTEVYDDDGDCYCEVGPCTGSIVACNSIDPDDCNDGAVDVNPGLAPETDLTNGIDDDCDGIVDQGTTDTDFDGYSPDGGDCDDTDPDVYPGAPELPDFTDNDCDGFVDEGTVLFDDDGDGYCEDPSQCSDLSIPGDCDDDLSDVSPADLIPDGRPTNPGAAEIADWRDNNCDGVVDEGTVNYDDDGDGYTETGGDCDDNDPANSPAMGNICP